VIEAALEAIRTGHPVVLPTDTVYGLCANPYREAPVRKLYRLKGRPAEQPIALVARDVEFLFECVPEVRGRAGTLVRALLPGAYTLIVPNPAHRFRWLVGTNPEKIGVRVPRLSGPGAEVLERAGAVAATSANRHEGPDPRRLEDVPAVICEGAAALVDGGELPGTPSTVLDLTGPEPRIVREGAVPAPEALERALAATAG
jgi:L-threonylcarbamoyladenylate synthase